MDYESKMDKLSQSFNNVIRSLKKHDWKQYSNKNYININYIYKKLKVNLTKLHKCIAVINEHEKNKHSNKTFDMLYDKIELMLLYDNNTALEQLLFLFREFLMYFDNIYTHKKFDSLISLKNEIFVNVNQIIYFLTISK